MISKLATQYHFVFISKRTVKEVKVRLNLMQFNKTRAKTLLHHQNSTVRPWKLMIRRWFMGVSNPKIGVVFTPPNHPFVHRVSVSILFTNPFLGGKFSTPIFGFNTQRSFPFKGKHLPYFFKRRTPEWVDASIQLRKPNRLSHRLSERSGETKEFSVIFLVGGWTNPSEKYARQIGNLPQIGVKMKKCLKPPPSVCLWTQWVWLKKDIRINMDELYICRTFEQTI